MYDIFWTQKIWVQKVRYPVCSYTPDRNVSILNLKSLLCQFTTEQKPSERPLYFLNITQFLICHSPRVYPHRNLTPQLILWSRNPLLFSTFLFLLNFSAASQLQKRPPNTIIRKARLEKSRTIAVPDFDSNDQISHFVPLIFLHIPHTLLAGNIRRRTRSNWNSSRDSTTRLVHLSFCTQRSISRYRRSRRPDPQSSHSTARGM